MWYGICNRNDSDENGVSFIDGPFVNPDAFFDGIVSKNLNNLLYDKSGHMAKIKVKVFVLRIVLIRIIAVNLSIPRVFHPRSCEVKPSDGFFRALLIRLVDTE